MRTSKFTPEQMVHILRQGDSGVPVVELCRQHGISEQTYYRWKKRFGDLGTAEVRELRQLREENRKLKQVVADLTLDKTILKGRSEKSGSAGPMAGDRRMESGRLPAQSATRLRGARGRALERPLHRSPAAADGLTPPPPRDCRGAAALRIPPH